MDQASRIAALSPAQRALLEQRLRQKKSQGGAIPRRADRRQFPLSYAQERQWFVEELSPGTSHYTESQAFRLRGRLDADVLERSLNEIVRRHEVLRSTYTEAGGRPVQHIAPGLELRLGRVDLGALGEEESEAEAQRLIVEDARRPFRLSRGPLLRASLFRLSAEHHLLFFVGHHIVCDGWSVRVLLRELVELYAAFLHGRPSPLAELPIQYADFAAWQREWLQGERLEAQVAYWKKQLGGRLPVLAVPTDRPRPEYQTYEGARLSMGLSPELTEALQKLASAEGGTLFMTLLTAFLVVLHYSTKQEEIIVGTDVANRTRVELEGLIGYFVNQLVLRTHLGGDPTCRELVQRVRRVTLEAYAHQDLQFNQLVEILNPPRDLSRNPIFQVGFGLQNLPMPEWNFSDLEVSPLDLVDNGTTEMDFSLYLTRVGRGLSGTLRYQSSLFSRARMSQLLAHYETVVRQLVAQPDGRLSALTALLGEADAREQAAKKSERRAANIEKLGTTRRTAVGRPRGE